MLLGDASDCHVWPFVVVLPKPRSGCGLRVLDRFEQVHVQPLMANGAIEPLDIGVLRRITGLDKQDLDPAFGRPGLEGRTVHLTAIVAADDFGLALPLDDPIQGSSDSDARQALIDLDPKPLAVVVIEHIECPESPSASQTIVHEVDGADFVRTSGYAQGIRPIPQHTAPGFDP